MKIFPYQNLIALTNDQWQYEEIPPVPTNIAAGFALREILASNIDKTICHGDFGMKDHGNRIIQRGLKEKL